MKWGLAAASVLCALMLLAVLGNDHVVRWTIDPSTRIAATTQLALAQPVNATITGTFTHNTDDPPDSRAEADVTPGGWHFESTRVEKVSPTSLKLEGTLRREQYASPISVTLDLTEPPFMTEKKIAVRRVTAVTELESEAFGGPRLAQPVVVTVHLVLTASEP